MMSYYDRYKNRMSRIGKNAGEAFENNTINFIELNFADSPTWRLAEVLSTQFPDIKQMEIRVINLERMGTLREILFRPNQGLNIGTYLKFDGEIWLVIDQWGDRNSTKYSCLVEKCNRTLKWKDANGLINELDCIASQSPLNSKATQGRFDVEFNKYDVSLPTGQLFVFIEQNKQSLSIPMSFRFIFGRNVYEVFGIDDTSLVDKSGFGIIQLLIKLSTKNDKDDFENRIAFNEFESEIVNPLIKTLNKTDEQGGRIW